MIGFFEEAGTPENTERIADGDAVNAKQFGDGGMGERQMQRIARLTEAEEEAANTLWRGQKGNILDLRGRDVGFGRQIDEQQAT